MQTFKKLFPEIIHIGLILLIGGVLAPYGWLQIRHLFGFG